MFKRMARVTVAAWAATAAAWIGSAAGQVDDVPIAGFTHKQMTEALMQAGRHEWKAIFERDFKGQYVRWYGLYIGRLQHNPKPEQYELAFGISVVDEPEKQPQGDPIDLLPEPDMGFKICAKKGIESTLAKANFGDLVQVQGKVEEPSLLVDGWILSVKGVTFKPAPGPEMPGLPPPPETPRPPTPPTGTRPPEGPAGALPAEFVAKLRAALTSGAPVDPSGLTGEAAQLMQLFASFVQTIKQQAAGPAPVVTVEIEGERTKAEIVADEEASGKKAVKTKPTGSFRVVQDARIAPESLPAKGMYRVAFRLKLVSGEGMIDLSVADGTKGVTKLSIPTMALTPEAGYQTYFLDRGYISDHGLRFSISTRSVEILADCVTVTPIGQATKAVPGPAFGPGPGPLPPPPGAP